MVGVQDQLAALWTAELKRTGLSGQSEVPATTACRPYSSLDLELLRNAYLRGNSKNISSLDVLS